MKATINRGYRSYEGIQYPRAVRFWPIFRNELIHLWKLRRVRYFVLGFLFVALIFGVIPVLMGFLADMVGIRGNQNPMLREALKSSDLYKNYQHNPGLQLYLSLFIGILGGGLIANDLKTRAIPLYFSKPLGWPIYLLAKLTVIAVGIFFVTFLPGIFMFLLKVMLSNTPTEVLKEDSPQLIAMFFNSLLFLAVFSPIILAISSLTTSYNFAMIGFVVLIFLLSGIGTFFAKNDPRGWGKNSHALDINFGLKTIGKTFYPEVKSNANGIMNFSRMNRRRHQEKKVEDENLVYANLIFWVVASLLILLFRSKKIEVQE